MKNLTLETISPEEFEQIIGVKNEKSELIDNQRLLAHQMHEFDGDYTSPQETNNIQKIHQSWMNDDKIDVIRIASATAQQII